MGEPVKRGKFGRPRLLDDPVKIAFWLERGTFERAKEAAKRREVSVAEVVRAAIARLAGEKPRARRRAKR